MNNTYYSKINDYIKNSPTDVEINWFDLPDTFRLLLKGSTKLIKVQELIKNYGKNKELNNEIEGTRVSIKKRILKINFPINLDQEPYIKLYALMISEGSIRTEFSLNVPEKEFHQIFEENLKKLISKDIFIKKDLSNNIERSRAPNILRYLIPIRSNLPLIIFRNKEFAREYLKIVFEAEGCLIFNLNRHKKYIKLARNSDISKLFKNEKPLLKEKRIFINKIKQQYPKQYNKLIKKPDLLILGEHFLLKYLFNIDSILKIENIRFNKLGNRKGKVSVKWVLYIYSGEDIKKFNDEIGFISKNKKEKCEKMLEKISSKRKQYFALEIMKNIQKNKMFFVKDFNNEMKKLGYTSPQKFIWDYLKNKKIIERIGKGKYKILDKAYLIS